MNWSSLDLGAVFIENDNFGQKYVVGYALQSNNIAKANYLSYEGETLVAVWVIVQFLPYFYGMRFIW